MKAYLGIDPGLKGFLCLLHGEAHTFFPMPVKVENKGKTKRKVVDYDEIYFLLHKISEEAEDLTVVIESQQQNSKTLMAQGEFQMACRSLGIQFVTVHPMTWKSHFKLIGKEKIGSVEYVECIYGIHCRGKNGGALDGMSDAFLIAKYWKEN